MKGIVTYLLIIFLFLFFLGGVGSFYLSRFEVKSTYPNEYVYKYIAHAGGGIDGMTYTNSLEAVNQSLLKGFKVIELDLIKSSDGVLIAAHDWSNFKHIIGYKNFTDEPMHSVEIKRSKIYHKYTPITEVDIKRILFANPDVLLFTDKTNDFGLIKKLGFSSRVYVEIFGIFDYFKAVSNGIDNPVLNVDVGQMGYAFDILTILLVKPKLVVLSEATVNRNPYYMNWLYHRGLKIFIYTSDDPSFINDVINKYEATIYVDFYNLDTTT
jgi:hypothetical protein